MLREWLRLRTTHNGGEEPPETDGEIRDLAPLIEREVEHDPNESPPERIQVKDALAAGAAIEVGKTGLRGTWEFIKENLSSWPTP